MNQNKKELTFAEYQSRATHTRLFPESLPQPLVYCSLGIAGETGELIEKVKKVYRDRNGVFDEESKELIILELGDILWYISQIAHDLNVTVEDVATANLEKLKSRADRNKLRGSGDKR